MASPTKRGSRRRRTAVLLAALALTSSTLAACSGDDSGKATLNWYINPDGQETLDGVALDCSTDDYDIDIQLLPSSATDQRTQLARRLAAEDSSTDLMSLDPVFVAEFANAGWLAEFTGDEASKVIDDDVLQGAAETATWEDKVYAAPQWANTQVLWYRKSLAEAAGLDPAQPWTWDQIIDAASENDGTVGVQANRYEGYVVWINAMILGAGGDIISDTEDGRDAKVDIDSTAGEDAARIIEKLASSPAAQPDLSVSNEGTALGLMYPKDGAGEFLVNWTFVYKNYAGLVESGGLTQEQFDDLGWARYPRTVENEESRPPVGGINIGVGAYSKHVDWAKEAAACVSSAKAQGQLAVNDGLMPSRGSVYDSQELTDAYPADLLDLFRESVDGAGPRPQSAYWSQVSSAIQSVWHSPTGVDDSTPKRSAEFLSDILAGRRLL
ncbi:extracellular solute-binding protein [Nocardioides campestrisoli]|uniref:extracellular solute-binding protein n=1 Tax=Nocardioides campestrisoli TaxID=2736757 RepID=UPI00163DCA40|nr:extracellular solute-binding protein [Nocardioides campestrisoli]